MKTEEGQVLLERFKLIRPLGSGGMGEVWLAEDESRGETIALKRVKNRRLLTRAEKKRLRAEFSVARAVKSEHIVRMFDFYEEGKEAFFTMEYVEGRTFETLKGSRLSDVLRLFVLAARGLLDIHSYNIVHRDIKPSNLMATPHDAVKILDFGLASIRMMHLADAGGTARYTAPEVFQSGTFSFRSDLYSMGLVFYETLCGSFPFPELPGILSAEALDPEKISFPDGFDHDMAGIIRCLLAPNPEERIPDALTLLNELEEIDTRFKVSRAARKGERIRRVVIHDPDFVGRRAEMSRITGIIDNFLATKLDATVIVEGEQGVGKSRFLEEIRCRMAFREVVTVAVSATETYNLAADILRGIWEGIDREIRYQIAMKWGGLLAGYFPDFRAYPEFRQVTLPPRDESAEPESDLHRIVALTGDLLEMAAKQRPILLLVDNFHEVDKRSLAVFQELYSRTENYRRVCTVLGVTAENGTALIEFPANIRITLSPFSPAETRDFIESVLRTPRKAIDEDLFPWAYRTSGGVVKTLRSILHLLQEEGLVAQAGERVVFRHDILAHESLDFLFRRKLASLSDKQRLILSVASIYRKFTTRAALRAVIGDRLTEDEFSYNLDILKINYLLREYRNGKIRIVHPRLQAMIYQAMPPDERRRHHRCHAEYLLTSNSLEDVNTHAFAAYHFLRGGDPATALRSYLRSASRSFFHLNTELTAGFLDEALGIVRDHPYILSMKQKTAVALFAGRIFYRLGLYDRAIPLLEEAFQTWRHDLIVDLLVRTLVANGEAQKALSLVAKFAADTPDRAAFVSFLRAYIAVRGGEDYRKAAPHLRRIRKLLAAGHGRLFTPQRRYLLRELEFDEAMYERRDDYQALLKARNDLIESAKGLRSSSYLIDALTASFRFLQRFGQTEKGYRILQQALKLAIGSYDHFRIARTYLNLALCAQLLGRWHEAPSFLDRAMEFARKGCGTTILKLAYFARGEYAIQTGDFSLAENFLFNAEELSFREKHDSDLVGIYAAQIYLYVLKGESGYAREAGGKLRRFLERRPLDDRRRLRGLCALIFLEAMSEGDREYLLDLSRQIEEIFSHAPETGETYRLIHLTARAVYAAKKGYEEDFLRIVERVEREGVSSNIPLFRLIYRYETARLLGERKQKPDLVRRLREEGRTEAAVLQARHFMALFGDLSFFVDSGESETLLAELERTLAAPQEASRPEDILSRVRLRFEEARRQTEILRARNRNYAYIIDIVKAISGKTEVSRIMEIVVKKILDLLGADLVAIVFRSDDGRQVDYLIKDAAQQTYKFNEIRFKGDVVQRMLRTAKIEFLAGPMMFTDTEISSSASDGERSTVAAVPVVLQGEIRAYLYLERALSKGSLIEEEIQFLEMLADSIGVIFENVKLVEIATTDSLTKVATRRHFLSMLRKEVEKARRYGFPLSLVIIDLDFFKNINDTYGHLMGDAVLRQVGKLLKGNVRGSDYVGRLGGEEFALLLPGTGAAGAFNTAEKIRERCGKTSFSGLSVTLSAGIASFHEDEVKNEEDFIEKADTALYAAKRKGRDRTILYADRGT